MKPKPIAPFSPSNGTSNTHRDNVTASASFHQSENPLENQSFLVPISTSVPSSISTIPTNTADNNVDSGPPQYLVYPQTFNSQTQPQHIPIYSQPRQQHIRPEPGPANIRFCIGSSESLPASDIVRQASPAVGNFANDRRKTRASQKKTRMTNPSERIVTPKRKLTNEDNLFIISYWRENYDEYCRSNKKSFATKASEELNRSTLSASITKPPFKAEQLERQLNYWLNRYKQVSKEFKDSGFGLTEKDPDSLKGVGEKKFRYFWVLHDILACRANINPPFVLQPCEGAARPRLQVDRDFGSLGTGKCKETSGNVLDDEEEDEEEIDGIIQPSHAASTTPQPALTSASQEGRAKKRRTARMRSNSDCGPAAKKKRRSAAEPEENLEIPEVSGSGSFFALRKQKGSGNTASQIVRSQGGSEKEGKNSNSRIRMMNDMLSAQENRREAQTESFAETIVVIEKEAEIREKEIMIMEKETMLRERESSLLEREQQRKDLEVTWKQNDQARKEKEETTREIEEGRKGVMMNRKMLMEEADQLLQQASMFMSLNLRNEALESVKQSGALVKKLREIGKGN